mmetsp:Transcript_25601/g.75540  ORF Transcript_25601/g.75540 Transcript_25601/m.75540 type:complete len:285 (-) Transcript_25601:282-1136(-)
MPLLALGDIPVPKQSKENSSLPLRMAGGGQLESHTDRTVESGHLPLEPPAAEAVSNVVTVQATSQKISQIQERLSQNAAETSVVLSEMVIPERPRESVSVQSFPKELGHQAGGGVASQMQAIRASCRGGQEKRDHFPEIVVANILANSRSRNVHNQREAAFSRAPSCDVGNANLVASAEQLLCDRKHEQEQTILLDAATSILRVGRNASSSTQGRQPMINTPRQHAQRKLEEAAANFILCSDGACPEALSQMQSSQLSESEIRQLVRAEAQEEVRRLFHLSAQR